MSRLNEYMEAYVTKNIRKGENLPWKDISEVRALNSFKDMLRMGFRLISTDRMHNHGTLLFQHPRARAGQDDDRFSITSNGYVRRMSKNHGMGAGEYLLYPINPKTDWYQRRMTSINDIDVAIRFLVRWLSNKEHYSFQPKKEIEYKPVDFTINAKRVGRHIEYNVVILPDGDSKQFKNTSQLLNFIDKMAKGE